MEVRYPRPLAPGDRIGVTAPSAGVSAEMRPRLDFCIEWLRRRGYEVVVGECLESSGVVSASPTLRAAELTAMLTDPTVRAVVPPWGGALAVEVLPHLDLEAIAGAEPTWVVGYSDISTLLVPLTVLTGVATVHGHNLMDTPHDLPEEVAHWSSVVSTRTRQVEQSATVRHRSKAAGHGDYEGDPTVTEYVLDQPGGWRFLDDRPTTVEASGRLIGGCVETLAPIAGSPFGDVATWADEYAPDGTIVYVEAAESGALDIARALWSLRLAGWFDRANAVLVGRTHAPDENGFTQDDAARSALGDLGIPVVLDVDCGHVVPQLTLVNGASAHVSAGSHRQTLTQRLR